MVMDMLILTKRQQVFSEMKKKKRRYDCKTLLSKDTDLEATALGHSSLCTSHSCLTWRYTYLSLRDSVHVFCKPGSLSLNVKFGQ